MGKNDSYYLNSNLRIITTCGKLYKPYFILMIMKIIQKLSIWSQCRSSNVSKKKQYVYHRNNYIALSTAFLAVKCADELTFCMPKLFIASLCLHFACTFKNSTLAFMLSHIYIYIYRTNHGSWNHISKAYQTHLMRKAKMGCFKKI